MQLLCGQRVFESVDMEQEEALKQQVLEVCREYLCSKLRLTMHISYLRSKFILSRDDDQEISAEKIPRKKIETFLDILSTKGSRGYDEFCNAIKEEGTTGHVLERLNTELQNLRLNAGEEEERDDIADSLPKPGEPGAPSLPSVYSNNSLSRPYSSSYA